MFLKTEEKDILNCFLLYQSSGYYSGYLSSTYDRIFKKTDRINLIYLSYCCLVSIEPVLDICSSERIINLKKEYIRENDCLLINENDYLNFLTNIFQKLNQHIFDVNLVTKINQIIDDLIVSNKLILLSTNKISYYEQTLQISDLVLQNLISNEAKQCSSLPSNCEKCEIIPQYSAYCYSGGRWSDREGYTELQVQYFHYYVVLIFSDKEVYNPRNPPPIVVNRKIYEENANPGKYLSECKADTYEKFRFPDLILLNNNNKYQDSLDRLHNLYIEIKDSSIFKVKVCDWEVINGLLQDCLYNGKGLDINHIHLTAHKYIEDINRKNLLGLSNAFLGEIETPQWILDTENYRRNKQEYIKNEVERLVLINNSERHEYIPDDFDPNDDCYLPLVDDGQYY